MIQPVTLTESIVNGTGLYQPQEPVVTLENRMIQSFVNTTVDAERNKNTIMNQMEGKVKLSPEKLIEVQEKVLNYNIEISYISTIVRKGVGAVETLLRA